MRMLRIGPYLLDNPVALAPMAGVTDLPFRKLCRDLGAGLVVSEMITSDASLWQSRKTQLRLVHADEAAPRSVQIAGSEPEQLAAAAQFNVAQGAQIIDINMGCPAKKVCRKAAGSALLRDEELVRDILQAVVSAVEVPVTLKMRTGWSPEQRNGVSIARIAEDSGIQALAVHGRTRSCSFNGEAEFDTIADICAAVDIPVFANGDIDSPQRARAVQEYTGAAGIMLGRAAQGRPWLPGQVAHYLEHGSIPADPDWNSQYAIISGHLHALHQFYGAYMGVRAARKHIGWYIQNLEHRADAGDFKRFFNSIEDAAAQLHALDQFFNRSEQQWNKELAA